MVLMLTFESHKSCDPNLHLGYSWIILERTRGEPKVQRSFPSRDHGERHGGCDLFLSATGAGEGLL